MSDQHASPRRDLGEGSLVRATWSTVALGVLAAAPVACEGPALPSEQAPGESSVTAQGRWAPEDAWVVSADPSLILGEVEGADIYQFVDVPSAAMQADGDIVVADVGDGTIRVFAPDGRFIKRFGGFGGGPGEFRTPTHVRIGVSDSIEVWDDQSYRRTTFDQDGELGAIQTFRREVAFDPGLPTLFGGRAVPLSSGGLIVQLVEKAVDKTSGGGPAKRPDSERARLASGVVRVSSLGDRAEFLGPLDDTEQVEVQASWGPQPVTPPLARTPNVAVQPNAPRVCFGDQTASSVQCVEDTRVWTIRWSATNGSIPISQHEILAWRTQVERDFGAKLSSEEIMDMIDQVPMPEERPPYSGLYLDHSGFLWVDTGPAAGSDGDLRTFLIFDGEGDLLGSLDVPSLRILEIGVDYLLGVRRDEFDVQYVWLLPLDRRGTTAADVGSRDPLEEVGETTSG